MRVTVFPLDSAVPWTVHIWTRWGCFVLQPPVRGHPFCVYLSPNATPWAATWLVGGRKGITRNDRRMIRVRRTLWGHGYDAERLDPQILDAAIRACEQRSDGSRAALLSILDHRADWLREAKPASE